MKPFGLIILLQLVSYVCPSAASEPPPGAVVLRLYRLVVARHPLGIPKGSDKVAIWPLLSKRLIRTLEIGQACEAEYISQHVGSEGKPEFEWIESGLFSGEDEEALPASALVERTEPRKDGTFQVYVRLSYRSAKPFDSADTFHWYISAKVISEGGRFVVDDVLLFEGNSTKVEASRLSGSFVGCDGPHWIGRSAGAK